MRSLISDIRHTPVPIDLSELDNDIASVVKQAHIDMLRLSLGLSEHDNSTIQRQSDLNRARIENLRDYALWLEHVALPSTSQDSQTTSRLTNIASNVYEFAGSLAWGDEGQSIFRPPLNDLLRSALLGSITGYQAQASLVARRVLRAIEAWTPTTAADRTHRQAALTILSLLARQFHATFRHARVIRSLAREAVAELKGTIAPNTTYLELDRAAAMALTCANSAVGMLVGSDALLQRGIEEFERIETAAKRQEDANHWWLAQRLREVVRGMRSASSLRISLQYDVAAPYRRALARDGILEFWAPQLEAISQGLLQPTTTDHFVVSIPTGAGKTLIAEMALLAALKRRPRSWGLYVTPSRALVGQASQDLHRRVGDAGIRVQTMLGGAELSSSAQEEVSSLASARTVTVLTPEKLDVYFRNYMELFADCSIVVFDEVHKLSDPSRGALIESLISRSLLRHPNMQLVLLSGVISNAGEIAAWLGQTSARLVVERRRPNRQIRGLLVRQDEVALPPRPAPLGRLRRVDFSTGLVVVHEEEDLERHGGQLDVQLPNLFPGFYTQREINRQWRAAPTSPHSTIPDHAVELATILSRSAGSTLVFVQTADTAERCCNKLEIQPDRLWIRERAELAEYVREQMGGDQSLARHCERGVAYHHARLPTSVQRALELALDEGSLRVVFSTPTLREGLNTAATNVVLAGDKYFDERSQERVSIAEPDFENVAGRAGRPRREVEGRVFLIPDSLALAESVGRRYLLTGEEALRARSQLATLAQWIEKADGSFLNLPAGVQSVLLTLKTAGLTSADGVRDFFDMSLWAQQEPTDSVREETIETCSVLIERAESMVGAETFALAARTGLSLSSVLTLKQLLQERSAFFSVASEETDKRWSPVALSHLLAGVLYLPEIRQGFLKRSDDPQTHLDPLQEWLSGASYRGVHRAALLSGALKPDAPLGDAVEYCSDLSMWLSWAFGACYTVLEAELGACPRWLGDLPLLTKSGVPTRSAALISLLGVADRELALSLSRSFDESGVAPSIDSVSKWLAGPLPLIDEFIPASELRRRLFRRYVNRQDPSEVPYLLSTVSGEYVLKPGQEFVVQYRGGTLVAVDVRGETLGVMDDPREVARFAGGKTQALAGLALGETRSRGATRRRTDVAVLRDLVSVMDE